MNNYNLKGRRAIVTGGAQGFGFAITKRFLESGAEVIIWDIDQKAVDEALKELSSEKCSHQIVDVTNFGDITKNIELSTKEKNVDSLKNLNFSKKELSSINKKAKDGEINLWLPSSSH